MPNDLLLCPFCGCTATYYEREGPNSYARNNPEVWEVSCNADECSAKIEGCATLGKAIAAWNKRADHDSGRETRRDLSVALDEITVRNMQIAVLREAVEELKAALGLCRSVAEEAHADWDNDKDSRVGKILIALSGRLPKYRTDTDQISAAIAKHVVNHG